MKHAIQKADILIEALPYIQAFNGKMVLIKLGGSAMKKESVMLGVLEDIVFLKAVGIMPILVHGGGPHINDELAKAQKKSSFIKGHRVTDRETLDIVVKVTTEISRLIATAIEKYGGKATCLCDLETPAVEAEKLIFNNAGPEEDLGFVGKVSRIDTKTFREICDSGSIPVIAPIAKGRDEKVFNINADSVASIVAQSLIVEKLVLLSDTHGIMTEPGNEDSFASTLHEKEIESLIQKKVITEGMLPKVNACISVLLKGVKKAHIIDGRIPHSLLLEIFTVKGVGTQVLV